jgi:hypothetical protein
MAFSFKPASSVKMDPELVRIVSAVVADNMFEVQSSISALQEQATEFQGRLASLEATAVVATKAPSPAATSPRSSAETALQTLSSRLDSLEATAGATTNVLDELRASPQGQAPQQPVTYYDFRQLENEVRKLEADLVPAKRALHTPSAQNLQQKFDDVAQICDDFLDCFDDVEKQVSLLGDQIEHLRIGSAIFALSAINLKGRDRRDCLSRLKNEEERMRQVKLGTSSGDPGNSAPRYRSARLPTISSGVICNPSAPEQEPCPPAAIATATDSCVGCHGRITGAGRPWHTGRAVKWRLRVSSIRS